MRKLTKTTIAIALSIGTTFTGISYAQAADTSIGETALSDSLAFTKKEASDRDMVMLLLTGTGPLADAHPEVVHDLGFVEDRPKPTPEVAEQFADYFLSVNPDFRERVADPVLSGNPLEVEAGLKAVTQMSRDTFETLKREAAEDRATPYGSGNIGLWHDAAAAAEVLVNGAIYANVAVATMFVVAGAVAAVVVLAYNFENDSMSPIEREHTIATLTHELQKING